jgi:hypothetical protein
MDPFTIAGIGFGLLVAGTAVAKALAPVRISRAKRWPSPPVVLRTRECPYAAAEIEAALAWWTERGAKFAEPRVATAIVLDPPDGCWLFDLRSQGGWAETHRGRTDVFDRNGNGFIERARSSFPMDVDRLTSEARKVVLLHEVGHGLGLLQHVGRRGHILNEDYTRGGLGDRGVRDALDPARSTP